MKKRKEPAIEELRDWVMEEPPIPGFEVCVSISHLPIKGGPMKLRLLPDTKPLSIICLAILIGILLAGSGEGAEKQLTVSGVVEPIVDVTLGLTVQGMIRKISCEEGQMVGKGATLLILEKRLEELEVARRKIIWESGAELESAEAQVQTLKEILAANKRLYDETRSVSKEELDSLTLQWKKAVAEEKLIHIRKEKEKVEYWMAVDALNKRELRSPVSGVVEEIFLKEGEICQPAQPLIRLVDARKCLLVTNLKATQGYNLRAGQEVDVNIHAGAGIVNKKGVISTISQVVDPASGLMWVKVLFDNEGGRITPGVTGDLYLPQPEGS